MHDVQAALPFVNISSICLRTLLGSTPSSLPACCASSSRGRSALFDALRSAFLAAFCSAFAAALIWCLALCASLFAACAQPLC